jgi:uncharacterized protein (TIGR00369 family)
MPDPEHHRKLERMYLSAAPINEYFAPAMRVGNGEAEVSVEVRPDFFHAAGAVHGSVYFKLLDDAAFFAVSSLVDGVFVLTVSFNVYLLRPVSQGTMTARGRVVHRSRRLFVAESEVVDGEGRVVGRGSGSFMKSELRLGAEMGYA